MNNKVCVELIVPAIEERYNVFVPINKKIGTIKKYIVQSLSEILEDSTFENTIFNLYDCETGTKYNNNVYVKESGIKNGSKLMLL